MSLDDLRLPHSECPGLLEYATHWCGFNPCADLAHLWMGQITWKGEFHPWQSNAIPLTTNLGCDVVSAWLVHVNPKLAGGSLDDFAGVQLYQLALLHGRLLRIAQKMDLEATLPVLVREGPPPTQGPSGPSAPSTWTLFDGPEKKVDSVAATTIFEAGEKLWNRWRNR